MVISYKTALDINVVDFGCRLLSIRSHIAEHSAVYVIPFVYHSPNLILFGCKS